MPDNKELVDEQDGVDSGTSKGESTSTATQAVTRQPQEKVDLTQYEDFRKWQSAADARDRANQQRAYEAEQRAIATENALHQIRMQGMDNEQKLAYQNQLLLDQLQRERQQRELDAFAIQRARDLQDIVRATGVPLEEIEHLPNVHVAWTVANEYKEKKGSTSTRKSRQEEIAEEADDRVDLSQGRATSSSSALQAKYDAARKDMNYGKTLEIMAEAETKGVTINEW